MVLYSKSFGGVGGGTIFRLLLIKRKLLVRLYIYGNITGGFETDYRGEKLIIKVRIGFLMFHVIRF